MNSRTYGFFAVSPFLLQDSYGGVGVDVLRSFFSIDFMVITALPTLSQTITLTSWVSFMERWI